MPKKKPATELTTEQAAKRLFPKKVREAIKKEAAESDAKGEKHAKTKGK
ncbi:MAG: hypothetical protein ACE5HD_08195 [Acidobacteriota bacterium]